MSSPFIKSTAGPYDHISKQINGHKYFRYDYKGWAVMDKKTAEEGIEWFSQKFMYDSSLRQVSEIIMRKSGEGYTLWHRQFRCKLIPKDPAMRKAYYEHNKITPPKRKSRKK